MTQARASRLRIGNCEIDPEVDEILRDGTTIKVEPRTMRVLLCLAGRPGQVVSLEELLDKVWADVVVTPDSVYTSIAALRRALGDESKEPRYIVSVPRRGYRLIAAVTEILEPPITTPSAAPIAATSHSGPSPSRRSLWVQVARAAVVIALLAYLAIQRPWAPVTKPVSHPLAGSASTNPGVSRKMIAVLPFLDMSEKQDQQYFADGMAEELIGLLAKAPGMRVIARTSSFSFRGKPDDIATIASKLKVSHVLEGSVRKTGNRLRVTTLLVRADTGEHIWSESYDRAEKDIFQIQDEIAESVVGALKIQLAAPPALEGRRGTKSMEAYYQFLLGQNFKNGHTLGDLQRAVGAYSKAIKLDPNYSAAYAGLAIAQVFLTDITLDPRGRERAEAAANRAVELAPHRAEGYAARAWVRQVLKWDWAGAEADLKKAVEIDPTNAKAWALYAELLDCLGRAPEAIRYSLQSLDLDPLAASKWASLSRMYRGTGDLSAARVAINRALEIEPAGLFNLKGLAEIELAEGHAAKALEIYNILDIDYFRLTGIAMAEHSLGHAAAADAALQALIAKYAAGSAYQIVQVYAWRGDHAHALDWLERAYRQKDDGLDGIKADFLLRSIREEPRYKAILHKMGLD